jgi:hypothetical protein
MIAFRAHPDDHRKSLCLKIITFITSLKIFAIEDNIYGSKWLKSNIYGDQNSPYYREEKVGVWDENRLECEFQSDIFRSVTLGKYLFLLCIHVILYEMKKIISCDYFSDG